MFASHRERVNEIIDSLHEPGSTRVYMKNGTPLSHLTHPGLKKGYPGLQGMNGLTWLLCKHL